MSSTTILRELFVELLVATTSHSHSRHMYRHLQRTARKANTKGAQVRSVSTAPSGPQTSPQKTQKPVLPPESSARPSPAPSTPPTSNPIARKVPLSLGLDRNPEQRSTLSRIPIAKGERNENFTPSPLTYPLGLAHAPQPGQNLPFDTRSWSDRKQDLSDPSKVYERRQVYLRTFLRPYFQEWQRTKYYKGKSFVSNERLFRRDKARYFPNIWGDTLDPQESEGKDMSPLLKGKISVVGVVQGQWAEEQVSTFIGEKENPELKSLLEESGGKIQRADVNMQGDVVRAWLVKMFKSNLRKMIPEERWGRYFMVKLPRDVRKGLTDEIRDAMGLLNTQVGYVYLLDDECKIRWAGSGHAWDGERVWLNQGIRRLLQEQEEREKVNGDAFMTSKSFTLNNAAESSLDAHRASSRLTAEAG